MKNINNISLRGNDSGNNTIISPGDYDLLFSKIKKTSDNIKNLTQAISALSSTVKKNIKSQEKRDKKIDDFIDSQAKMHSYFKRNYEAMKKFLSTNEIIIESENESEEIIENKEVVPFSPKKRKS